MRVSLEYLYHFQCEQCCGWWSQADLDPQVGDRHFCPHCGHRNTIEVIHTFRDGGRGSCLQVLPDRHPQESRVGDPRPVDPRPIDPRSVDG